jgi:hypothetical protein
MRQEQFAPERVIAMLEAGEGTGCLLQHDPTCGSLGVP